MKSLLDARTRRSWDSAYSAVAEAIQQDRPGWLVVWGCSSRLFWAYPMFPARCGIIVYAYHPESLLARMELVERHARIWPPIPESGS